MPIRVGAHLDDWASRLWLTVGWAAILFPAIYMTATGWDSGEHANVPIAIGLAVSAIQGVVWVPIWLALDRWDKRKRRRAFGIGVPLCLVGSLSLLAATQRSGSPYIRLAWASAVYLLVAALVIRWTRVQGADRSTAGGRWG